MGMIMTDDAKAADCGFETNLDIINPKGIKHIENRNMDSIPVTDGTTTEKIHIIA